MIKILKKILLSSLSVLGVSMFVWTVFVMNPKYSYANSTNYDFVTVYHNEMLSPSTEEVVASAGALIQEAAIFDEDIQIHLCMNDDNLYPNLHPLAGEPIAYAMFNKTILKSCMLDVEDNVVKTQWPVNENEIRHFNLTTLLAHEFTHNLQYNEDATYVLSSTLGTLNWKLEGHAEYIARSYKNDGKLKAKIQHYLLEEARGHVGIPVFKTEDGTLQNLMYYKFALVVQYLMEVQGLDFSDLCAIQHDLDHWYSEMIAWSRR